MQNLPGEGMNSGPEAREVTAHNNALRAQGLGQSWGQVSAASPEVCLDSGGLVRLNKGAAKSLSAFSAAYTEKI